MTKWPKDDVHPRIMSERDYGEWARDKIVVLEAELEAVKAREEAARPTPCIWRPQPHGDETEYWETTCDNAYCFEIDGPTENDYSFCPGCGHPILVAPLVMTGMEEGDVLFDLVAASEPPGEEGT